MASIRAKIVVPFAVLFLVAIGTVALLAARTTASNVDARMQGQMADLASVLSQAAFAANPDVLERVKTIVGGELATVDAAGAIVVTTLGREAAATLGERLAAQPPQDTERVAPTRSLALAGTRYRATYAPVQAVPWRQEPTFLYLLVPESQFRAATWRAVWPILLAAAGGAVAAIVIGLAVARWIARPIEALAGRMRGLAGQADAGAEKAPAGKPPTRDEVGELSDAFQALLASLRQAEAQLVGSERLAAVGQVAAAMGHELRNPLSGIKMSAQLLGKKLDDLGSEDDESVQVILGEIARLEVVVEDLLAFAGPAKLDTQPGDANQVVRGVLFFMKRQLDHADVMIDDELDDTVPEVPLDPQRLRQVVLNLVLNAIEAMPGGGTLTVRTEAADDTVDIVLEDTGRGIKPEDAESIFEPFFTTKKGGSGLGLAVSKLIVEAHGGTIRCEPTSLGSRFVVSLPRRAAPGSDEPEPADAEPEATASR